MKIEELRKIAESATPGPWKAIMTKYHCRVQTDKPWTVVQSPQMMININPQRLSDCEFIATFNPDRVLKLLEKQERQAEEIEAWKDLVNRMAEQLVKQKEQLEIAKVLMKEFDTECRKVMMTDCNSDAYSVCFNVTRKTSEALSRMEELEK